MPSHRTAGRLDPGIQGLPDSAPGLTGGSSRAMKTYEALLPIFPANAEYTLG
jgi:hypothetical protein